VDNQPVILSHETGDTNISFHRKILYESGRFFRGKCAHRATTAIGQDTSSRTYEASSRHCRLDRAAARGRLTPRGISAQKYTGFPTLFLKIAEKTCERRDSL
jgi:hypothetical protein